MAYEIDRIDQVRSAFGNRSNSSIYSDVKEGLLPPPVSIGRQSKGWPRDEMKRIRAARIAGATDDEIRALVKSLVVARASLREAA